MVKQNRGLMTGYNQVIALLLNEDRLNSEFADLNDRLREIQGRIDCGR